MSIIPPILEPYMAHLPPRDYEGTVAGVNLQFTEERGASFLMVPYTDVLRYNGVSVQLSFMRFICRADTEGLNIPHQNDFWELPPEIHACVYALGTLLYMYHGKHLKYEGDADATVSVKGTLHAAAIRWGVDINDVAQHFATAKAILAHKDFTHPDSFEALERHFKFGGTNVHLLH